MDPVNDFEVVFTVLSIVGYAMAVAIGRLIVFDVLITLPKEFWEGVYWSVACGVFVIVLHKIRRAWWND